MKTFNELEINDTMYIYHNRIIEKVTIKSVNCVTLSDMRPFKIFNTSNAVAFGMHECDFSRKLQTYQNNNWIFSVSPFLILKSIISKKLPFIGIKIDGRLYDECEKYILAKKIYEHKTF